ncbi:uncharacterized protein LOC119402874 [Rhipicephalus sanguineus]|uniref:uncharacterized protein LOC119402874 n=1 Tax=Rhipicephalus sanguineus TaxID=34632 RepID=UPI001893955B|nr:uncharacterized protein LOC119402874 [Rhipicephalus sanguineus]
MQAQRTNILLWFAFVLLLCTIEQGPTYVLAATVRPEDPLYYFRGSAGGVRPPRHIPQLPTIHEEGGRQEATGRRALQRRNQRLAGTGIPPITPLGFQGVRDHRNRLMAPEHRAPQGYAAFIGALQRGLLNLPFGGEG